MFKFLSAAGSAAVLAISLMAAPVLASSPGLSAARADSTTSTNARAHKVAVKSHTHVKHARHMTSQKKRVAVKHMRAHKHSKMIKHVAKKHAVQHHGKIVKKGHKTHVVRSNPKTAKTRIN